MSEYYTKAQMDAIATVIGDRVKAEIAAAALGGGGGNTNIEGGNASSVAVSNIDGGVAAG